MALAESAVSLFQKANNIGKTKNEDDSYSVGDQSSPDTGDTPPEPSEGGGVKQLEDVVSDALADVGVTTADGSVEENGDAYVDVAFEDGTSASIQFYVQNGEAKMALLTSPDDPSPKEAPLPDSLVGEGDKLNLSAVGEIPVGDIKALVSDEVETTNTQETFRRFRGVDGETSESISYKRPKKRISTKLKNENKRLREVISKLKKA